jgi:hypothetical protein
MRMTNPSVLYMFAQRHDSGVPRDPVVKKMNPMNLDSWVQKQLKAAKFKVLHVWDWQADGIRHKSAQLSGTGKVTWSDPTYLWLAKHRTHEE